MSDTLRARNARFFLTMQDDGNLVLYDNATGEPLWASNTVVPPLPEPPEPETPPPPQGEVRLVNGAFHDRRGAFNPVGATFFWAPWGYKFDRDRMVKNARFLAASKAIEYVRLFAQVDWQNRPIDPRWDDYEYILHNTVNTLYEMGLRSQVTLLAGAGAPGVATRSERETFVRRVVRLFDEFDRPKLFGYEIANEAVGLNTPDGWQEMRDLARLVKSLTTVPVAITAATHVPGLYVESRDFATYATAHWDRDTSKADGYDRPTRQPWGWPGEFPGDGLPETAIDNEGIGPYSSVYEDRDPLRNVTRRAVAFIAGNAASLYHCGPGIYGDEPVPSGAPADFWSAQGIQTTLKGFRVLKTLLPAGLSGWNRTNHSWPNYPFAHVTPVGDEAVQTGVGCVRAYCTDDGTQFVCLPFGIRGHVEMLPKFGMDWTVYDLLTGDVTEVGQGRIVLTDDPPAQLILARRV